jgi:lysophospholipase L1-like esterase
MRSRSHFSLLLCLLACAPQVVVRNPVTVVPAVSAPSQWEPEIAQFEAQDRATPSRPGSIVFVGSSSIRMWTTLDRDFPGVPVMNRGFGGSEAGEVAQFAERIVVPYKPPVVVFYAGDNDLAAGKTPAQVLAAFQSFVATIHRDLPRTRVVFVSIKPSLARWAIVDKMRAANQLVRDYVSTDSKLAYVDVFTPMLDASGQPRRELYLKDGLHMTPVGYAIWRDLIGPVIR